MTRNEREYFKVRGIPIVNNVPEATGTLMAPCPQHVEGRCAIYAERPTRCQEFPIHPDEIAGTPCTYWFEPA